MIKDNERAIKFTREVLQRAEHDNQPPLWVIRDMGMYHYDYPCKTKNNAIHVIGQTLKLKHKQYCVLAKYDETKTHTNDPYTNIEVWELVGGIPTKVKREVSTLGKFGVKKKAKTRRK
jgi:hypothetical protein